MIAKICDRCGRLETGYEIEMRTIYFSASTIYRKNDKIANYDLCPRCEKGMWEYLDNNNTKLK
jgi:hypothetical protein